MPDQPKIVVSDTGPIHYLLLLGLDSLLPTLFERIIVPPAVVSELRHPNTPPLVREWARSFPEWVQVSAPTTPVPRLENGQGEAEAIALAKEMDGILLTDDDRALKLSRAQGIASFGTLGVLQRAHALNLIDIDASLHSLGETNYRHTKALFERTSEQARDMRRQAIERDHDIER